MALEIKLPELGENIKAGDVTKVLVAVGDTVVKDQPLLELETGKATIEVPAPAAGTIQSVLIKPGDKVAIGQPVMTLAEAGASPATAPAQPAAIAPAPAVSAPVSPAPPPMPAPQPAAAAVPAAGGTPAAAAPSVRLLAREIGLDITLVPGSGPGGRISADDVKQYAKRLNTERATVAAPTGAPLPDFAKWGPVSREAMSTIRKMTADQMARAWREIPHVTQHDEADITELEALRKRFAPRAEAAGGKLTITAILLKILAAALKVFPKFNASLDSARQEIVLKQYYHLGVAVDTPRGLLVPVLRDADRRNIIQLAVELGRLAAAARDGKLAPNDLAGGTFTLTNLGGIGGSFFTPIVNAPEVAILGAGRARLTPCCGCKDNVCAPRLMLPLSLSYDHRLIDGADGARFLRWVVEAIEEPLMISLEG